MKIMKAYEMRAGVIAAGVAALLSFPLFADAPAAPREIYWYGGGEVKSQMQWDDANNWIDAGGNVTTIADNDIIVFDSTKWTRVTSYIGTSHASGIYQLVFRGTSAPNQSGFKCFNTPNEGVRVETPYGLALSWWIGIGSQTFPIYIKESTATLSIDNYLSGSATVVKTGAGSLSLSGDSGSKLTGSVDFSGGGSLSVDNANALGKNEAKITSTSSEHCSLNLGANIALAAPVRFAGPAHPDWAMVRARNSSSGSSTFSLEGDVTLAEGTGLRMAAEANQAGTVRKLILEGEGAHCVSVTGAGSIAIEKVTIPANGSLEIPAGVSLKIGSAVVDGTEYAFATGVSYSAPGAGGDVTYPWLAGEGSICSGHPDESTAATVTSAIWTGATDTDLRVAGNWQDSTLPDFAEDRVNAIFATGGSLAAETTGRPIALDSITFNGTRDFTLGGPGHLYLGNGLSAAAGEASRHYAVTRPVWLRRGQLWSVAEGASLWVSNGVHSLSVTAPLVFDGGGTFNLAAPSDFGNRVIVSNATVHAYADNVFGGSASSVLLQNANGQLYCHGVTLPNAFEGRTLSCERGTTNVVGSFYRSHSSSLAPLTGDTTIQALPGTGKTTIVVNGNCGNSGSAMANTGVDADVILVVSNGVLSAHDRLCLNSGSETHLWASGNRTGGNCGSLGGNAKLYTHVPYAITRGTSWEGYGGLAVGGYWDLCGCDQALAVFAGGSSGEITSAAPAILHHRSSLGLGNLRDHSSGKVTCACRFTGAAGFEYTGTVTNYTLAAVSTTTGSLVVNPDSANAWLTMSAGGSWTNAANVLVSNGVFRIAHKASLGRETTLWAEGGTIDIAQGVSERVGFLRVRGGEPLSPGSYGGPDSCAANKPTYTPGGSDYVFSGAGVLRVGKIGCIILFK